VNVVMIMMTDEAKSSSKDERGGTWTQNRNKNKKHTLLCVEIFFFCYIHNLEQKYPFYDTYYYS
jgi:hypothetical protein